MSEPALIREWNVDAAELHKSHPPKWTDRNKQIVAAIADPSRVKGPVRVTRWSAAKALLATSTSKPATIHLRRGGFNYTPLTKGATLWTMNFADSALFGFYSGPLFAQDEIQSVEHPTLGSIRELLFSEGQASVVDGKKPTPVLISGGMRLCETSTRELYGRRFTVANESTVRSNVRRLDPPTRSNIVAITAPWGREGRTYSAAEIELVLDTAYTGFRAAVLESTRDGSKKPVELHTGMWGCGVFGGDKRLMATLQMLAADLAGISALVFHCFDSDAEKAVDEAKAIVKKLAPQGRPFADVVTDIVAMGFRWASGDGN